MKTQAQIKVISKDTKTGTNARGDWSIDEYTIVEDLEFQDGSHTETCIIATAGQSVEKLVIGGLYDCTIFITSNEWQGKHYAKFRITNARCISLPEESENEKVIAEQTDDSLPF